MLKSLLVFCQVCCLYTEAIMLISGNRNALLFSCGQDDATRNSHNRQDVKGYCWLDIMLTFISRYTDVHSVLSKIHVIFSMLSFGSLFFG